MHIFLPPTADPSSLSSALHSSETLNVISAGLLCSTPWHFCGRIRIKIWIWSTGILNNIWMRILKFCVESERERERKRRKTDFAHCVQFSSWLTRKFESFESAIGPGQDYRKEEPLNSKIEVHDIVTAYSGVKFVWLIWFPIPNSIQIATKIHDPDAIECNDPFKNFLPAKLDRQSLAPSDEIPCEMKNFFSPFQTFQNTRTQFDNGRGNIHVNWQSLADYHTLTSTECCIIYSRGLQRV